MTIAPYTAPPLADRPETGSVPLQVDQILEKGSSPVNEDRLLVSDGLFGVFDGATSLCPPPVPLGRGRTGGAVAAGIAKTVFAGNHYPLPRLAREANGAISREMAKKGICTEWPDQVWSTSAAVVRLSPEGLEWFRTGDAQILLVFKDGSHRALGNLLDHDYPTLSMMKAEKDKTLDNPLLRRQVLKVRRGMNRTYGVLNGDPRAEAFFNSGKTSLAPVAAVLLFTDGLSLPCETPSPIPDFTPLVREFLVSGLHGLYRKIRRLEAGDARRKKYPRFKCHDDVAAVALTLEPLPA